MLFNLHPIRTLPGYWNDGRKEAGAEKKHKLKNNSSKKLINYHLLFVDLLDNFLVFYLHKHYFEDMDYN